MAEKGNEQGGSWYRAKLEQVDQYATRFVCKQTHITPLLRSDSVD